MLIIALVLAVIGLAALVFAVVTSNELVAWVCIGASVLGVVLLIIDALQERRRRDAASVGSHEPAPERVSEPVAKPGGPRQGTAATDTVETATSENYYLDYPEDADESTGSGTGAEMPPASAEAGTAGGEQSGASTDAGGGETVSDDPDNSS